MIQLTVTCQLTTALHCSCYNRALCHSRLYHNSSVLIIPRNNNFSTHSLLTIQFYKSVLYVTKNEVHYFIHYW